MALFLKLKYTIYLIFKFDQEAGMKEWLKSDWREKPRVQMPDYLDAEALEKVEGQLSNYPPLVLLVRLDP